MKKTHTVLDEIVRLRKEDLEVLKKTKPLASFASEITQSERDFYHALKAPNELHNRPAFILECKKASPSRGLIREDFEVATIVKTYSPYASAISVLTETRHFQGEFEFLTIANENSNQPILCKDFIIDAYQIKLARFYGAHAILLMLSVLTDEEYQALSKVAHSLNMGVLTEVNDEEEVARALTLGAQVIGINNRDLRDLSIDLSKTERLRKAIPPDKTVISESGILDHQTVKELSRFANGFLIGSALMAENNLEIAVRQMILGHHKVCGLTSAEDARKAFNAGATYGGLIFVENTPRCISLATAKAILTEREEVPLAYIGVFIDEAVEVVARYAKELNLYGVQLHGKEDKNYIKTLKTLLPPAVKIIKALAVIDSVPPMDDKNVDHYLLDGRAAGSGQPFDWHLLDDIPLENCFLAGGLNQDNIKEALRFKAFGLDFNSGTESELGKKDDEKLKAIFALIHGSA